MSCSAAPTVLLGSTALALGLVLVSASVCFGGFGLAGKVQTFLEHSASVRQVALV